MPALLNQTETTSLDVKGNGMGMKKTQERIWVKDSVVGGKVVSTFFKSKPQLNLMTRPCAPVRSSCRFHSSCASLSVSLMVASGWSIPWQDMLTCSAPYAACTLPKYSPFDEYDGVDNPLYHLCIKLRVCVYCFQERVLVCCTSLQNKAKRGWIKTWHLFGLGSVLALA